MHEVICKGRIGQNLLVKFPSENQRLGAAVRLSNDTGLVMIISNKQKFRTPHGTRGHRDILTLNIRLLRLTSCLSTRNIS